jgi:DnaJ family protein C protein 28
MKEIEEQIRQAMAKGKFNDLPGKGKPIKLDDDPLADPEWRLARHMLKSSGFTLPWIELRQEIETDLAQARAALQRAWKWRREALDANQPVSQVRDEWSRAVAAFHERVIEINKRIFDYNLQVPVASMQLRKIDADRELNSITSARDAE